MSDDDRAEVVALAHSIIDLANAHDPKTGDADEDEEEPKCRAN